MSRRGTIYLGDLVRAVSLLQPQDLATAAAMADMLGLAPQPPHRDRPAPAPPSGPAASADGTGAPERVPAPAFGRRPGGGGRRPPDTTSGATAPGSGPVPDGSAEPVALPATPAVDGPPGLPDRPVGFSLSLIRSPAAVGDPVVPEVDDEATELSGPPDGYGPRPVVEPPWTPEWARGVMVAAVSVPLASRRLDQRALVRKVSRQEVLRAVPWQRRSSTRRGVQLLLDHGPGMTPFQDDRRWLQGLLGSVAGRDRVEVLRFTGSPLRGVAHGTLFGLRAYRAPAPGTPVVLVSDLGRVRPRFAGRATAGAAEWLEFADRVLHAGCPTVCLSPFPATAYPSALAGRIALIPFDRRISLRHAREATRQIHRMLESRR
ncbi:hypothetical protein [Streptomyces sp. NPDC058964]|uniref:hypothetical protein n=1 Tax=Streptomyces sp. NPDC058964 TaxID=3346681 RepID=UPI00367EC24D